MTFIITTLVGIAFWVGVSWVIESSVTKKPYDPTDPRHQRPYD